MHEYAIPFRLLSNADIEKCGGVDQHLKASEAVYYTTCRLVGEFFLLSDPDKSISYGISNGQLIFSQPGTQLQLVSILAIWDAATYYKKPVVGHGVIYSDDEAPTHVDSL